MLTDLEGTFHIQLKHEHVEGGREIEEITFSCITIDNEQMELTCAEAQVLLERYSEALERLLVVDLGNLDRSIMSSRAQEQFERLGR